MGKCVGILRSVANVNPMNEENESKTELLGRNPTRNAWNIVHINTAV